jgi:hypothetical protein
MYSYFAVCSHLWVRKAPPDSQLFLRLVTCVLLEGLLLVSAPAGCGWAACVT